jgi:hypothetical protein
MTARLRFRPSSFAKSGLLAAAVLIGNWALPAFGDLKDIGAGFKAELSAQEVQEGGLVQLTLESPSKVGKAGDLIGTFDGREFPFFPLGENRYGAIFGVSHDLAPGKGEVTVRLGEKTGKVELKVTDGAFASEKITVAPKQVNPPKKSLKRIQREQKEIGAIYRHLTQEKYWQGAFKFPIESAAVTSAFGTRRMYNGEQRNFHPGMDLKARTGTKIRAPAKGRVVLAKNLYFTGNTVVLDHGYGLITLYAHMSKIKVKVGQVVDAGKILGLSGATGRVSGPHLHWQAVVSGVKINPKELTTVLR